MSAQFNSGRTGQGPAYVSDRSGSPHAKFMRLTARALAPLGVLTAWFVVGVAGKPLEGVRAELGRPFPALVLIAFILVAMPHARAGMDEIIIDYVHEPALKEKALKANKWLSIAVMAIWVVAVMLIAASK